jgi:prepilin-type processing-associated H-X9-DG protein
LIELMVVVVIISVLIMLLLPAIQASRESARRAQCSNNLIQLGLALAHYESTHRVLPPGSVDPARPVVEAPNRMNIGWIVQILPFLEQRNAAKQFRTDRSVYGLENLTVRGIYPGVLHCPSDAGTGVRVGAGAVVTLSSTPAQSIPGPTKSNYAACHHAVEGVIDVDNSGVLFLNSHVTLEEVEDGLTHTIFLGETISPGDELGWASGSRATLRNTGTPLGQTRLYPTDVSVFPPSNALDPTEYVQAPVPNSNLPFNPTGPNPVGGFGGSHPLGANFLLGDGSVRFLRKTIDPAVYRNLGGRADGALVGDDQF